MVKSGGAWLTLMTSNGWVTVVAIIPATAAEKACVTVEWASVVGGRNKAMKGWG